jgi:hypothetical protein
MYKFAAIGALIAALAVPAGAAGKQVRGNHARDRASCTQPGDFRPLRNYAICAGRFWIRDPETGKVMAISFGRLQHINEPDRP